ncbi:Anthranilate phosphoribosyltransferase [hydrothermal vent metagenome]|uniref:anthranilate phosphoribosyltransferase n=1 Tax=hydrothermal vent metagenome TaxID=652676 RepID=A0A1W1B985_9ZZZZ
MTYDEAKRAFLKLFRHEMSDEQMREFLLSLKLDESTPVETIAAAAEVMREFSIKLPIADELKEKAIDIVGTGGDKIGSFNISTATSIVCAAAGSYVAKHGNRSITSKSGSADVLEMLGVRLKLTPEQNAKLLEETGWCFMFAQNHHPAMKFIMPIRKSIPDKTVFNILGPLTNPADVKKSLLGVFDRSFVPKMAKAMQLNGAKDVMVVSSEEGMDEIGISGVTYAAHLKDGKIEELVIDPAEYGIRKNLLKSIKGGDAEANARIIMDILQGYASDAQRDVVLLNAATALYVDGMAGDIKEGLAMAKDVLEFGIAFEKLNDIVEVSSKL